MAYYDERRYRAPRDRAARPVSSYAPEYYDEPRYARYDRDVYPEDSVEEIQREYPPGDPYGYERGYDSRRSRRPVYENVRRSSSVSGYDPYYDGGYSRSRPHASRYDDRRKLSLYLFYVDCFVYNFTFNTISTLLVRFFEMLLTEVGSRRKYDSPSPSPSPPRQRRRKSFSEKAMSAIGLGSSSKYDSDRGRDRSSSRRRRYDSYSRSRSRDRDDKGQRSSRSEQRLAQAARAALTAGAVEAFRARKDPGEWTGEKGKRVLTAAVTAAGTDGLVDRDPRKHGKRHVLESTLAGLAASHFMNGGRSSSQGRNGRSGRGRSASGGLKELAATGVLAAAGKEIYDRISRSRSRPRGRADSDSEDDRRGSKKRSKSVSEYITKGISALGLRWRQPWPVRRT
ncbi:uncharacterized protein N7483_011283 [Penicillium malachiteum]|uniref:uncharacterized protein n=1 Tax=Penicillium malachiteum TaxID=1324776 RepID=UPI0025481A84|nr:uncharacterized protein N7483_011283 [Penicillium malachiteum]KAJ5714102.1 hypothetical protein N7483_011283 [Penicillium malachiteum]